MFTDNGEFKQLLWENYKQKQISTYSFYKPLDENENGIETLLRELGFKNE